MGVFKNKIKIIKNIKTTTKSGWRLKNKRLTEIKIHIQRKKNEKY